MQSYQWPIPAAPKLLQIYLQKMTSLKVSSTGCMLCIPMYLFFCPTWYWYIGVYITRTRLTPPPSSNLEGLKYVEILFLSSVRLQLWPSLLCSVTKPQFLGPCFAALSFAHFKSRKTHRQAAIVSKPAISRRGHRRCRPIFLHLWEHFLSQELVG